MQQESKRDETRVRDSGTAGQPPAERAEVPDLPPREQEADKVKGGVVGPCDRPRQ